MYKKKVNLKKKIKISCNIKLIGIKSVQLTKKRYMGRDKL
jgi:hypothetical protein